MARQFEISKGTFEVTKIKGDDGHYSFQSGDSCPIVRTVSETGAPTEYNFVCFQIILARMENILISLEEEKEFPVIFESTRSIVFMTPLKSADRIQHPYDVERPTIWVESVSHQNEETSTRYFFIHDEAPLYYEAMGYWRQVCTTSR